MSRVKDSRRQQIYAMLQEQGEIQTKQLCQLFGVSDMTIRRDLDILAKEENVKRTHGGAVLLEFPVQEEKKSTVDRAKEAIAKKAMEFVDSTQKIFIDSGTTTIHIARNLSPGSHNIVVTNNLKIVEEVADKPHISVLIIGGTLRVPVMSCYGAQTEEQISRYKVDIAFLGATTVGENGFFYDGYPPEVGVKQSIIQSAQRTFVLVDSSKFDKYNLISYSHVKDVTGVITDSGIQEETREKLEKMGANLIVAEV